MHRSVLLVLKESKTELQLWRCIAFGCLRHALLTRTWYVHKMLPSQGFPLRLILTGLQHQAAVTPCDSSHWLCHYNFFSHRSLTPPQHENFKGDGVFCFVFYIHHQIWQIGHFCAFPSSSILIVVKHNYTPKKPQQNVMFMMFFNSS